MLGRKFSRSRQTLPGRVESAGINMILIFWNKYLLIFSRSTWCFLAHFSVVKKAASWNACAAFLAALFCDIWVSFSVFSEQFNMWKWDRIKWDFYGICNNIFSLFSRAKKRKVELFRIILFQNPSQKIPLFSYFQCSVYRIGPDIRVLCSTIGITSWY